MKLFFWKREKKRFDLDAALAKAKDVKPGEPLVVEGNPSAAADMQALVDFIEHGPVDLLPARQEDVAALEATVRVISPSGAVKEGSFTLESTLPTPLAAAPAPAKPKPAPKQTRAHRAMSQKREARRSK